MRIRLCRPKEELDSSDDRAYELIRGGGDHSQTEFEAGHYSEARILDEVEGLYWLEGKTVAQCQEVLFQAFLTLQATTAADDWEYSCANLFMLMWGWCKSHPDGVFRVY